MCTACISNFHLSALLWAPMHLSRLRIKRRRCSLLVRTTHWQYPNSHLKGATSQDIREAVYLAVGLDVYTFSLEARFTEPVSRVRRALLPGESPETFEKIQAQLHQARSPDSACNYCPEGQGRAGLWPTERLLRFDTGT